MVYFLLTDKMNLYMGLLNPGVFVAIHYPSANMLGTWFSGNHGNDRLMVELDYFRGLFQPKQFLDSSEILTFDYAFKLIFIINILFKTAFTFKHRVIFSVLIGFLRVL